MRRLLDGEIALIGAGAALLATLLLQGCTICDKPAGTMASICAALHEAATPPVTPPQPPAEAPYVVTAGQQECRSLAVPAALELVMAGKNPGTAEREEVTLWAVTDGGDWSGGNPPVGTYTARCHDSRPDWGKLKVYGVTGYAGEPPLRMAWVPSESYRLRLAVDQGRTTWTATRLRDNATATAVQDAPTPARVTICYGDPGSRKAAIGAKITGVVWSGAP